MIEWDLTEFFLTNLVAYGPGMLALFLFLGTLGVSLPGTIFVIAAGAFVRQGIFSVYSAFPLALAAAVTGDSLSYGMGYYFRDWIGERVDTTQALARIRSRFQERCGLAVYLTRFVFTPLAVPVNLFSGGTGYPFHRFFLFDFVGEVTWLILYGTIGYIFASHWTLIGGIINNVFGVLLGLLLLAGGIYVLLSDRFSLAKLL